MLLANSSNKGIRRVAGGLTKAKHASPYKNELTTSMGNGFLVLLDLFQVLQ